MDPSEAETNTVAPVELTERETSVYYAKLAEQAERYDEMVSYMKSVAMNSDGELSVEERNLLSVAYKNSVGARRASWRIVTSVENKQKAKGNTANVAITTDYRKTIEAELTRICSEILSLLTTKLITKESNAEALVFCHKMRGDYCRYIAEFLPEDQREGPVDDALSAYQTATELASELPVTHPIRLGLALNFSVFYYEIKNERSSACNMAQVAFDQAIGLLDTLSQDAYRDSTLIMQLLRDNLTLWTSDQPTEKETNNADAEPVADTAKAQ